MPSITSNENWIGQLPPRVRAAVDARMDRVTFKAGDVVKATGDPSSAIHQMQRGYVKLMGLYEDGRQSFITIYAPGNCFSETAMVGSRNFHHSAVALTDCVVGVIPREAFWALYQAHPEIPEALCRKFAMAISRQLATREERATHRLSKLVAMMFETLAEHCADVSTGNSAVISAPLTQSEIAAHFDVARQSVHREIDALRTAGLIDKQGGRWIVRDLAGLRRW
jgi:CRP-like cAMP-binding protein